MGILDGKRVGVADDIYVGKIVGVVVGILVGVVVGCLKKHNTNDYQSLFFF